LAPFFPAMRNPSSLFELLYSLSFWERRNFITCRAYPGNNLYLRHLAILRGLFWKVLYFLFEKTSSRSALETVLHKTGFHLRTCSRNFRFLPPRTSCNNHDMFLLPGALLTSFLSEKGRRTSGAFRTLFKPPLCHRRTPFSLIRTKVLHF